MIMEFIEFPPRSWAVWFSVEGTVSNAKWKHNSCCCEKTEVR